MALCQSLSVDCNDAEDIAQDTMIRLWQVHDKLDKSKSQDALARTIAYRLVLDSRRRTPTISIDLAAASITVATNDGHDMERQEKINWIMEKMKSLPTTQSTILQMRHIEMRPVKEIADILGIKETSVNTLLGRARHNLTNMIRKGGILKYE